MDYLSRILQELTETDEPETRLPQLRETVSFAAARQKGREKQVSPAEETVSAGSAAELANAFAALEESVRRGTSALGTERKAVPETVRPAAQPQNAAAGRSFGGTENFGQTIAAMDAEELSRIFQRDARCYG